VNAPGRFATIVSCCAYAKTLIDAYRKSLDIGAMNESEYYAGEFTDADLNALADAGEVYLDESGFFFMPTQEEMQKLSEMGETLLFIDWFSRL
jgi:hypothetical protein